MAKEIKIKITAENKGLLSTIANSVSGLKKFAASAVGMKNVKIGSDGVTKALNGVEVAAKAAGAAVGIAGKEGAASLKRMESAADKVEKKLKAAGAAGKKSGTSKKQPGDGSAEAFGQTLANVTIIANGAFTILGKFKDAIKSAVAPGVEYTKQMESARVGVAGILLSMTKLNGRQLELNEALTISEETFESLQQKSLQFNLNIRDTSAAFQAIVGPGLAAQMTLEEMTAFAVQGTKAVKSFGLDSMQVVQELRSMVSGDINADSQVAKAMGITATDVAQAKQTAGGLFTYLTDKLKGFTLVAGEIPKTISGKTDMLTSVLSMVSSKGFEPLINTAKEGMDAIIGYLTVTTVKVDDLGKETKKVEINPELVSKLKDVSAYLSKTAKEALSTGKAFLSFLSPAVPILKFIGNHVVIIAAGFATWIVARTVIVTIRGVATAITVVEGVLKTGAVAWRAYNLAIATGSTNMKAFAIATKVANVGLGVFKITVRGLLASTGIGLLAVGVGYLAEKMLNLADNTDKVAAAKDRLTQGEGIGKIGTLGNLSALHEGKDIDKVSSGENDPDGGVSYGTWQLSSKQGSVDSFVRWLTERGYDAGPFLAKGDSFYDDMGNAYGEDDLIPGTPQFTERWHAAVKKFGASFEAAYAQYFKENYYDNFTNDLLKDFGFDANSRSDAVRQVLWSTSVQHGPSGAYNVMADAAKLANVPNISWLTDEQLIPYIYQARKNVFPKDTARYTEEQRQAADLLATNPQPGINSSDLSLADPVQTAKELKEAELKFLQAQREGVEKEYIAKLEEQEADLKQKFQTGEIGNDEYFSQIGAVITNKTYAQIKTIQAEIASKTEALSNKNYTAADKKGIEAEIVKLTSDVRVKETELKTALSANTYEYQQAALETKDKALDAQIAVLKLQGKLEQAAKLEQQKSDNLKSLAQLTANKAEEALKALKTSNAAAVIEAQYTEATTNIGYVVEDMGLAQGKMIQSVLKGTTSVSDSVKQYQIDFDTKTAAYIATLNTALAEAKKLGLTSQAREIETKLREIKGTVGNYIDDLLEAVDEALQAKIDAINANRDLTPLQKEDLVAAAQRATAAQKSVLHGMKADAILAQGGKDAEQLAAAEKGYEGVNSEAAKLASILDKVHEKSKTAFEDGLLTFLSDGITQCNTLGEAFRNLANTVLSAIQKVYAEALTKNIMNAWFPNKSGTDDSTQNPAQKSNVKKKNFKNGGTIDDAGVVHGPGTITSDSILAYSQKYGTLLNIGNGEGVLSGKAMRNVSAEALKALNDGVDPRKVFASYATGGIIGGGDKVRGIADVGSMAGPQDIVAKLASGDTNIHLKTVNVTDLNEVGRYIQSRNGEKVMVNWMKNNAGTVRQILAIKG